MTIFRRPAEPAPIGQPRLKLTERRGPLLFLLKRRLALGLVVLGLTVVVATAIGPVAIPVEALGRILLSTLPGIEVAQGVPHQWREIVLQLRLPRVLTAALAGAALAMAGVTYQGVFRNPLADPYLIGVAAGAGLGATILLVLPLPVALLSTELVPLGAFAGAMLVVVLAYRLARVGSTVPAVTLILAGVALSSIATAVISFLMLMDTQRTFIVLTWLLGGFNLSTWGKLGWALLYVFPAAALVMAYGRILNVLQLDEEEARQLGVNVERVKLVLLGAASLATAAAVSVSGLIGFVGLIVPHAVRLLWGPDHRHLLPMSMVMGAAFLVLADLLARTVAAPREIPVGIVTALAGAPFFLYLLRQRTRRLF